LWCQDMVAATWNLQEISKCSISILSGSYLVPSGLRMYVAQDCDGLICASSEKCINYQKFSMVLS
jgi:hypothetical protein